MAAPLPTEANEAIAALVERVRSRGVPGGGRDVRWVRMDGLHLTLRFLGPTLDPRVEPARAAVLEAAAGASAFDIALGTAGAFPDGGRPRALWVAVRDGADALAALAGRLDGSLVAAGWPPETRPFKAHLTLARSDGVPAGRAIADALVTEAADLRITARIDRIGLYREPHRRGAGALRAGGGRDAGLTPVTPAPIVVARLVCRAVGSGFRRPSPPRRSPPAAGDRHGAVGSQADEVRPR